jgi:hypothetical protein
MADRIGPDHAPKRSFGEKCRRLGKAFTTKYDAHQTLYLLYKTQY